MPTATLTAKGQVVIPVQIRERYSLTPGTQVEFIDNGHGIELKICRRIAPVDPATGFGMLKAEPAKKAVKRLADFDVADMLGKRGK